MANTRFAIKDVRIRVVIIGAFQIDFTAAK
jgi:hypothetical protein